VDAVETYLLKTASGGVHTYPIISTGTFDLNFTTWVGYDLKKVIRITSLRSPAFRFLPGVLLINVLS